MPLTFSLFAHNDITNSPLIFFPTCYLSTCTFCIVHKTHASLLCMYDASSPFQCVVSSSRNDIFALHCVLRSTCTHTHRSWRGKEAERGIVLSLQLAASFDLGKEKFGGNFPSGPLQLEPDKANTFRRTLWLLCIERKKHQYRSWCDEQIETHPNFLMPTQDQSRKL